MKFPRQERTTSDRRGFFSAPWQTGTSPLGGDPSLRLLHFGRDAMACRFEIIVPASARTRVRSFGEDLDLIDQLECQLSVFRPQSELSILNRRAFDGPVAVEEQLRELLELSRTISHQTEGAFDITSAPLSRCWGWLGGKARIPTEVELSDIRSRTGSEHLMINPDGTVRFRRPIELNLGGIGKGYALDRLANRLRRYQSPFLLHAGHSTLWAEGDFKGCGWRVAIRNPTDPGLEVATLTLQDQALSTSGSAEQKFARGDQTFGHVIDPRTGQPADGHLSATAIAPTAAEADALSTAFFIMSLEEIGSYCERHGVGAIIVLRSATAEQPPEVKAFGVSRNDLEVNCQA